MPETKNKFPVLLLVFMAGGMVGLAAGGYAGGNFGMGYVINNVMDRDARDTEAMVGMLRNLQDGNTRKAEESIESLINDRIIIMDEEPSYPGFSEVTRTRVDDAFKAVSEYRKANPRNSSLATDKMVDAALKKRGLQ